MDHDQYLKQKGVRVSSGWLQQWQQEAARVDSSFKHKTASAQRALLWQEVLRGDLHVIGAQALPADLQVWHKRQLSGMFVLQADEVVNIAAAAKYRQVQVQYSSAVFNMGNTDLAADISIVLECIVPPRQHCLVVSGLLQDAMALAKECDIAVVVRWTHDAALRLTNSHAGGWVCTQGDKGLADFI